MLETNLNEFKHIWNKHKFEINTNILKTKQFKKKGILNRPLDFFLPSLRKR